MADVTPAPEENILVQINRETGLILFSPQVIALHEQGKGRKALALFKKDVAAADDLTKQQMQPYLEEMRLWLDPLGRAPSLYTLNGVGTRLYGKYKPQDDGTYIATLWFVLLFIPIWPLSAFLVLPAERGWMFLAKAPFPLAAKVVRIVSGLIVLGLAGLGVTLFLQASLYTDVLAYNGYDVPLEVHIGEASGVVPAHQHGEFPRVRVGTVRFAARVPGGDWLEETEETLAPGRGTVVYNVAGRGVLVMEDVVYGTEAPYGTHYVAGKSVEKLKKVDYAFVEPPQQKQVEQGSSIHDWLLTSVDQQTDLATAIVFLHSNGQRERALQVVEAEVALHPDNFNAGGILLYLFEGDWEAGRKTFQSMLQRHPDSVELHRAYQEACEFTEQEAEMMKEYAAAAAQNPDSAMFAYLHGRGTDDPRTAAPHFRRALELDPDYHNARRALAYAYSRSGREADADREYTELARRGGPAWAAYVWEEQLRLARALGAGPSAPGFQSTKKMMHEDDGIPVWARNYVNQQRLRVLDTLDLITVADRPARVPAVFESMRTRKESSVWPGAKLDLALAAGDIGTARRAFAEAQADMDPAYHASVALFIALTRGAAESDRATAFETHGAGLRTLRYEHLLLAATAARTRAPEQYPVLAAAAQASAPRDADPAIILRGGPALEKTAAVDAELATWTPRYRGVGYASAYFAVQAVPGSARAQRHYRSQARAWAFPTEVPRL